MKGRWKALATVSCSLFWSTIASGQLIWGEGGGGGNGPWNTTAANWWDGSANVPWTNGSAAIFSGTGGTVVASVTSPPTVSNMTFDAPGYTIQGGSIRSSGLILTITTNQPATISSGLQGFATDDTLVKNGAATLTISGSNSVDRVQVNSGEYFLSGTSDLGATDVTIADAAGAKVTLGQTADFVRIGSLSGGGASGGILQPNDLARTVSASISGSGIFRGTIQDNGGGKIAISVSEATTLARPNTYSGTTSIGLGKLVFSESGSALNSEMVSISSRGTLRLDNATTAVANRLSDVADVTVEYGSIELAGNSFAPVEEQLGVLKFSGLVTVNATQPGSAETLLTFAGVNRENHGAMDFAGNGQVKLNGMANRSTGIVGAYATAGNEWAALGADNRATPFANYATDVNAATPSDHVKILGGSDTSLTASAVRATLNLQNSSATPGSVDLGAGNTLTLQDGGILSSGTGVNRIQGGALRSSVSELVVTARNTLTIDSNIGETVAGTVLTKSGAGTLTLTGTNSYSGNTVINDGILVVSSDANLGSGSEIEFNSGTLKAAGSFSSTKSLTRGTSNVERIDTAGFDVTFSGTSSGLTKVGAGTLTLSNPSPGGVTVHQGTLALTNPTSGGAGLFGGTLLASGFLSSLNVFADATLDIGGSNPATLTIDRLSLNNSFGAELTVRFDLGPGAQDLWTVVDPASIGRFNDPTRTLLFDFRDLGGVTPGASFTLMNVEFSDLSPGSKIGFAPSAIAAGWRGSFHLDSDSLDVTITATPEPGSAALLVFGGMLLGCRFRARSALSGNGRR